MPGAADVVHSAGGIGTKLEPLDHWSGLGQPMVRDPLSGLSREPASGLGREPTAAPMDPFSRGFDAFLAGAHTRPLFSST